jgi:hypothetical protein
MVYYSMVVEEIDIERLASFKPEDDSPVRTHGYGPKALEVTTEGVQTIARHVYTFDILSRVKHAEDVLDLLDVLRIKEPTLSRFEQQPQPFMPEACNHAAQRPVV